MLVEKQLATRDGTLHYVEGPQNQNSIVLIHGIYARWQELLPVMPVLALHNHLLAPDLRGHGKSRWTPGAYHLHDFAGDIVTLIKERTDQPAVLVGHSLGAGVALTVAALTPQLVAGVVAIDPPMGALTADRVISSDFGAFQSSLRNLLTSEDSDTTKQAKLAALAPNLDPLTLRLSFQRFQQFDPEQLGFEMTADMRVEDLLPKVSCPTLLIQCNPALGGLLDDETAQKAASLLPDCIHVYCADVGHNIQREQPEVLARMICDFVELI